MVKYSELILIPPSPYPEHRISESRAIVKYLMIKYDEKNRELSNPYTLW